MKDKAYFLTIFVNFVFILTIFVVDIHTFFGHSIWLLYIIPLLVLSAQDITVLYILSVAGLDTIFITIKFFMSYDPFDPGTTIFNASLYIITIFTIAYLQVQRKKANTRLNESEVLFRSTFEQSYIGTGHIGENLRYLRLNRRYCDILGYSHEELYSRTFFDITYAEDLEKELPFFRKLQNGEIESYSIEKRFIQKNGHLLWCLNTKSRAYDAGAHFRFFISTIEDISVRKQYEQALKESEAKLLEAQRLAHLGSFYFDMSNGKVEWSEEIYRIFEIDVQKPALSFEEWMQHVHPEDRQRLKSFIARGTVERTGTSELEYRVITSGNKTKHLFSINKPVFDNEGKKTKIFGTLMDVTERKLFQQRLEKTLKDLERSNSELEQFAYVASHDLQEPLRMMHSYAELLEKRYKGKLDESADDFLNFITDGAKRMQHLINDLLQYSRVSTRGKPFEPVDCMEVLSSVMDNLQISIEESGAIITYNDLPVIHADETQMVQLFQNLLSNSIKFRAGKTPEIHISAEEKDNEWIFLVKDNGIGIAPEFHERVFIIFQRLHSSDKYPGTGIGLAVCKKIVERHQGKIRVESELNKGTTFYFSIPKRIETNKNGN
ncbi:MAG TPA: ATP-binding protein [Ignavibacteriales bacterium]|nr:ATP-binding protein [Ignavibacteriales bacterium]